MYKKSVIVKDIQKNCKMVNYKSNMFIMECI